MADSKDWSTNSNEAVRIRMKIPAGSQLEDQTFHPAFTYPIYGEEESIFGYRGLEIRLDFESDTLKPSLNVSWKEKFAPVGDTKADEVEEKIKPFLPPLDEAGGQATRDGLEKPFTPPGQQVISYKINGQTFGVWTGLLSEPAFNGILRNVQVLVPFFIEGGTEIELDDPAWTIQRWRVFLLYSIDEHPTDPSKPAYTLAGYSTAYCLFFYDSDRPNYYQLPEPSPAAGENNDDDRSPYTDTSLGSLLPARQRISQFLILPPYQSSGHGSYLYNSMMSYFLPQSIICEISVEDPNESFDDLRDINDLIRLRHDKQGFSSLRINVDTKLPGSQTTPLPTSSLLDQQTLSSLQKSSKMAPRQFARMVEMHLLDKIPMRHRSMARISRKDRATDEWDRAYYFWRLLVKQRLYKHNKELLAQLELEERVEKLEETLNGVERDYVRLLEAVAKREKKIEGTGALQAMHPATGDTLMNKLEKRVPVKRRVVDEDDEDEEGQNGEGVTTNGAPDAARKKAKVSEGA